MTRRVAETSRRRPFAPYEADWGAFAPLRLRARQVAEGVYAGQHRSARRGPGVEFGGQRPYVAGDDLRFLDRRALLRHDRLMVRQFETETDRSLWLVVDASLSMGWRGSGPGSKLGFACLLAAALARIATSGGDPVGLVLVGGSGRSLPAAAGREAFERIVWTLEAERPGGDLARDPKDLERALGTIHERARRGSIVVVLSDLLDLPEGSARVIAGLATRGRRAWAVQTLDPDEASFPYRQQARFRALEGDALVETDPEAARDAYLAALAALQARYEEELVARGGALVRAVTSDDPVAVLRRLLRSVGGGPGPA